jgi:hypothetical protein
LGRAADLLAGGVPVSHRIDGYRIGDCQSESEELESVLFSGGLICGCGKPGLVVSHVLRVLEMYAEDEQGCGDYKKLDAMFPGEFGELARWCIMYWMDGQELNEHGSGLTCGGWMTAKGWRTLELLRKHGTDPDNWAATGCP